MLKQVILLSLIAYAASVSVDQCAWGESYWCSSLQNAGKCQATQHCLETVWKNQKLTEDTTDTCTFCENIIKDVKSFLDNKQDQAEIKQYLDAACSIVPDSTMAKQCQDAVDTYLPTIIGMIDAEMDPQTVCAAIGLCTGLEDLVSHKLIKVVEQAEPIALMQKAVQADYCGDCKKFMSDVQAIITDATTEKELEEMMEEELCAQLGGLESMCDDLVEQYVPMIMDMLKGEVDPTMICQSIGFCNSTMEPQLLMKKIIAGLKVKKLSASTQCILCEFVMKEVDSLLVKNTTQKEIMAALDKVCSIMPTTIKQECDDFVKQYGPAVIQLLLSQLTPAEVCSALGLCSQSTLTLQQKAVVLKAGEFCSECKIVIQYLDTLLTEQPTEKEIEQALDKVCNFLPKNMSKECDSIVDQYAPLIIQIIAEEATPDQVCSFISLCNSTKAVIEPKIVPQKVALLGDSECTWGPAYWCQSRENAKKCKAEKHCEKHVWN